jgi:hypothetical protein
MESDPTPTEPMSSPAAAARKLSGGNDARGAVAAKGRSYNRLVPLLLKSIRVRRKQRR